MRKRISFAQTEQYSMLPRAGKLGRMCWRGLLTNWKFLCMLEKKHGKLRCYYIHRKC
jgi:hypothetical protein